MPYNTTMVTYSAKLLQLPVLRIQVSSAFDTLLSKCENTRTKVLLLSSVSKHFSYRPTVSNCTDIVREENVVCARIDFLRLTLGSEEIRLAVVMTALINETSLAHYRNPVSWSMISLCTVVFFTIFVYDKYKQMSNQWIVWHVIFVSVRGRSLYTVVFMQKMLLALFNIHMCSVA
jgi:hypothetical protein